MTDQSIWNGHFSWILSALVLGAFISCQKPSSSPSSRDLPFENIIFPEQGDHVHGPTIAELPNGDLIAAWFQGSGERWADDVVIMGARLFQGDTTWSEPFVMADVEGYPDINPVLYLSPDETLWLFWYPVLANQWETSIPMFRRTKDYYQEGCPNWEWQDVIFVKPGDKTERGMQANDRFVAGIQQQLQDYEKYAAEEILPSFSEEEKETYLAYWSRYKRKVDSLARGQNMIRKGRIPNENGYTEADLGYPVARRMGWQTKNKPILSGNRLILPLYSDGFDCSLFAITEDWGQTWQYSNPVLGDAGIQATILSKSNGELTAYLRDNGAPPQRIQETTSNDNGLTWSIPTNIDLPNSGAGFDGVTLSTGEWVLAYNHLEDGRHNLSLALSNDEGKTWVYKALENDDRGKEQGTSSHYPSIIEGKDGVLHVIYSYHHKDRPAEKAKTIKYACVTKDWILQ